MHGRYTTSTTSNTEKLTQVSVNVCVREREKTVVVEDLLHPATVPLHSQFFYRSALGAGDL